MPDVTATTATTETPAPNVDELALAAFDKGLVAAASGEVPEDDDEPDAPEVPETPEGEEPETPETPPADGAETPDPAKDTPADTPVDHASEIAAEITERGLKGKTADRFTELATSNAETRAALTELGVEKISDAVVRVREAEATARQWNDTVLSTGATPEQFGNALGYLQLINSRDPAKMRQAYDAMATEQKWLAEQLGLAAAGGDPLDSDPELKARVLAGDVPRDVAESLVQTRAQTKLREENNRTTTEQTQQQQAVAAATQEVAKLGASLRAADSLNFDAKLALLTPSIRLIQNTLPPSRWTQEIEKLYRATPNPPRVVPKVPAKIGNMPLRPTGGNSSDVARIPKTDVEAFDMGIEEANRRLGNR
jgi:hypothetical protein